MIRKVLVPLPPIAWGGLAAFAVNIQAELRKAGWEWIVIVPDDAILVKDRLVQSGVKAFTVPMARLRRRPLASIRAIGKIPGDIHRLVELARMHDVSLIQAVGAHHYHGWLTAKRARLPLVWQIHSDILGARLRSIAGMVIRRGSDAIMTNGAMVARSFGLDDMNEPRRIVFYAPVNTEEFKMDKKIRAESRAALGYSEHDQVIVTLGNRVRQKNHEMFVEVAGRVGQSLDKAKFLILGAQVAGQEAEYERAVMAKWRELEARDPGRLRIIDPENEVHRYLCTADIFVLTSIAEGIPIALAEAMSMGLPVVSVDVGSICELVDAGKTGFLTRPGDVGGMSDRLQQLVEHEDMRQKFGASGRERVCSEFTITHVVEAHDRAYRHALAEFEQRHLWSGLKDRERKFL